MWGMRGMISFYTSRYIDTLIGIPTAQYIRIWSYFIWWYRLRMLLYVVRGVGIAKR